MLKHDQLSIIEKLLGPLELQIMEILWARGESSIHDVVTELNKNNEYAYTTIMTVMSRLAEKGILSRIKSGRLHQYSPAFTPEEFIRNKSSQAVKEVLDDFGDTAIAQFVDNIKLNPKSLNALKQFVEEVNREGKDET